MTPRPIRLLVAFALFVAIGAGLVFSSFTGQNPADQAFAANRIMAPAGSEAELEAEIGLPAQGGPPEAPTFDISAPETGKPVKAISFDKDLRHLPQIGNAIKKPMREMLSPDFAFAPSDGALATDAVTQAEFGKLAMPSPVTSFKGMDLNTWGGGWPPDTHGDVGPNHYIQAVNTSVAIFNKSGTRLAAFTFDNFFGGTGTPCDANNMGDPIVLYDQVSGRWIVTDFAWSRTRGPFYECIAVSKTADPVSGGWWFYGFQAHTNQMQDYPKLGVWSDGIYMSANMFYQARTYRGVKVWAFNRDDMINGRALRNVSFTLGTGYFSLLPSNARGAMPPAGTPNYFVAVKAPSTLQVWKFKVDWANTANSTFTGPTNVAVASYSTPSVRVPQKGSSETLDALADRLMTHLQYANVGGVQSLWVNHTVKSSTATGIRWYELRNLSATPTVYQQGTYAPDSSFRWMGSLAVDKQGNMALGYSVSSSTLYPAIRYAGRLVGDSLGSLGQSESSLIEGTGAQSGGYNRWGDYASMMVDPVDGCTFWFTTEYYESTGNNWQTRIGSFKYPGCTP